MNKCIACKSKKIIKILEFGKIPISNNFVKFNQLAKVRKYQLGLNFCKKCFLVQNSKKINNRKIFNKDYLYYSSYSKSWLDHAKELSNYCIENFNLNKNSKVMEIASNDGYLLKYFKKRKINSFGVEPSYSVAKIARKFGIKTHIDFFSSKFVKKKMKNIYPNIIIALNVMAHTPKLNDFVRAISLIMNDKNICIIEVPYLINLLKKQQIDTIYHEHYSYFSLSSLQNLLKRHSLDFFDVKLIKTHGGSLRIFIKRKNNVMYKKSLLINKLILKEKNMGLQKSSYYKKFSSRVKKVIKINEKKIKKICKRYNVWGYGAAAKATVMTNLLNLKYNHISYVVDRNKFKQSRYIPGSNIKIINPNNLKKIKPHYILIFVWNIKDEVVKYLKNSLRLKSKFITINPRINIS